MKKVLVVCMVAAFMLPNFSGAQGSWDLSFNNDRSECVEYNFLGLFKWNSGQVHVTVTDSSGNIVDQYDEPCGGLRWGWQD
jgi:hypothetical protein